ncbi:MAG: hypothetical protein AB7V53_17070 [Dongiaceae bacterium]
MQAKKRVIDLLFGGMEGETVDVKFFLGENRNITEDELCDQISHAWNQVKLGVVSSRNSIDGDCARNTVEKFLKA